MRGLPAVRHAGLPGVLIQLHSSHNTPCTNKGIALCIVLGLGKFLVPRNPHTHVYTVPHLPQKFRPFGVKRAMFVCTGFRANFWPLKGSPMLGT